MNGISRKVEKSILTTFKRKSILKTNFKMKNIIKYTPSSGSM